MIAAALRQATSSTISGSATKKMGAKILKLRILYLNVYMIVYVYISLIRRMRRMPWKWATESNNNHLTGGKLIM